MKKMALILILVSIFLSGCSKTTAFKQDKTPAIAEITTTQGGAYVVHSVSDSTYAVTHANVFLGLVDGEKAKIHFFCNTCGYEVEDTLIAPFARLYSCECPEQIGETGNAREYISISTFNVEIK